ncbi:MAG TPA: hypothetical protein DDZ80_10235, partial [Cyanobacteria bacterium UBA8803]|nr:hypothetical protein [Cyanobacteria bacterium UBA8803]
MPKYHYKVGGSLEYQHPTYVVRQADSQLYEGLKALEFCYVLNSRQMGKSSLRVQMMNRLQQEGVSCASIDLTLLGSNSLTPENWYGGIAFELLSGFNLVGQIDFNTWWRDRLLLPPLQRLSEFIEEVLLNKLSTNLVIFIDEIDCVKSLNFSTDDFFAWIRACYNLRADRSEEQRLTFCLLGVATPSDLIEDKGRTPFNIGRAIELTGFTFEEAKLSLTLGLQQKTDHPEQILKEVLDWTRGQPFLTQKLCQLIALFLEKSPQKSIGQLVQKYIINNWEAQDEPEHLKTIRNRLLSNEQRTGRLLGLYQQLWQQGEAITDDSPEETQLRLSGLVVKQQGKLRISNRIYQAVFNQKWIDQQLAALRPYSQAIAAWLASHRQDESRLLRGRALQEALDWKAGKSLSVEDDDFLGASQQKELEAQRQANKILTDAKLKAEQLLAEARQAKLQAEQLLVQTKKLAQIERDDVKALRLFEVEGREIAALLLAMQVGQALQQLARTDRQELALSPLPPFNHRLALQIILEQMRERNQFSGHQGAVNSVSFSPNGNYLATASEDGTARLWDEYGHPLAELIGHQGKVRCVSFSPNGEYLATASEDGTARLWDLAGHLVTELIGHQAWVGSISFSPNGEYLATASEDGSARLWNLSGQPLAQFWGHQGRVLGVSFSPNGKYLATAAEDNTARLWDLSGKQVAQFLGHRGWVLSISFSPSGEYLATAAADSTARLWDLSGKQIAEFWGHRGWVWHVNFSPDGEYLATAAADSTARLWNLSGKQLAELKGHQGAVVSVCFSPNGKRLATASADGTARLWELFKKQLVVFKGHKNWVLSVAFSPQGEYLATASYDGTVKVWDLLGNAIAQLQGHQGWVASVSFSPDGKYLATAGEDGTVKVWDLLGNAIAQLQGHQGWVLSVSFSPSGEYLATTSADGTARLWDVWGNSLVEFKGHQGKVASVSFSPNGEYLATASDDRTALLWDLKGHRVGELEGHRGLIWAISFSPDGKYLATASDDGTAGLWDLSGQQIAELQGHQGGVLSVSF